jgi:hypothetical protein
MHVTYLESRSHYGLERCIIRKDVSHQDGTRKRTRKSIKNTHFIQCGSLRRVYTKTSTKKFNKLKTFINSFCT